VNVIGPQRNSAGERRVSDGERPRACGDETRGLVADDAVDVAVGLFCADVYM
jgi:hypothetical protein